MKPQTELWIYRIVSLLFSIGSGWGLYTSYARLEDIPFVAFCFCISLSLATLYVSVFRSDLFYEKDDKNDKTM